MIPREALLALSTPTTPPFAKEIFYNGLVQYPSVDSTPVDVTMLATTEGGAAATPAEPRENEANARSSGSTPSGTCVICLDAPMESAYISCSHMIGCMFCLKDIESKK